MGFLSRLFQRTPKSAQIVDCGEHSARMGWRYVDYISGDQVLRFQIEPMAREADIVYIPDGAGWRRSAPAWARESREALLECLKAVAWNRRLVWRESPDGAVSAGSIAQLRSVRGSLESTEGGQRMDGLSLFNPGAEVTPEQARTLWLQAVQAFVRGVSGRVTIFERGVVPGSVFQEIEIPMLRAKSDVTLDFK